MKHLLSISLFASVFFLAASVFAQSPDTSVGAESAPVAVAGENAGGMTPPTNASNMLLMDATTGAVLAEKNSTTRMFPSSMSKLMTEYLLFEELKRGSLKLTDTFFVSENAWRIQGSKMFVPLGGQVTVEELIRGITIQSGNDACVVVAEGLAGSEAAFAQRLNAKAKEIGMQNSNFVNSSGWPDENHYTTAADLAKLASRMIADFPEYYHYFSEKEFTYNNIRQYNRNLLLGRGGVDGLKTGHTEIAGYGIVLSAREPGTDRRLILVINGLSSMKEREREGEFLLNWGFRNFENVTLASPGQVVTEAPVFLGKSSSVGLATEAPLVVTLPKVNAAEVKIKARFNAPITAPVAAGQPAGELIVTLPNGSEQVVSLVTVSAVARKNAFARIPETIRSWF
ncbi:MAG: D-alanyl-D-alanine carboxypeptidase family protein [Alphaproteobacteria bacterium]